MKTTDRPDLQRILVTGGAGFIGSALIRHLVGNTDYVVFNLDKLTYAGNLSTLTSVSDDPRYRLIRADIADPVAVHDAIRDIRPRAVVNLAAETHVDRSIDGAAPFIQTNVVGTFVLLDQLRVYWNELSAEERNGFRFLHVSTDEVFGTLGPAGRFAETTPYDPSSPYSASKAASDHLVRAWHRTYGLPALITNCSNNYGPYQYPEKLIPLMIANALSGKELPVYGEGANIRDWLFVNDHVDALVRVLEHGAPGRTYNIGGDSERTNLDVVESLCACLGKRLKQDDGAAFRALIRFVPDRPGHDLRYAIDSTRIKEELGWQPRETFETGLQKTVDWYLDNRGWWQTILDDEQGPDRRGLSQSLRSTGV